MATITVDQVLDIVKGKPAGMTATAIADALGFSKAARIKSVLDEAVSSGALEIDNSGRYDMYKATAKVAKKAAAQVAEKDEKVTVLDGKKVVSKLPEATQEDLRGFKVESIKFQDKLMKKITKPDGKSVRLENDEKLLVINNEPKYIVKTAEDVIVCMRAYALANNLTVYTVEDIKQNRKVSTDKDVVVADNHIMFMSIKKHNKAA